MSAIKTHEMFDIVHGGDLEVSNEEGEHTLNVKTLMVSRQHPGRCQIFTQRENTGSLPSYKTKVYHGQIENIKPADTVTEFSIKARIDDEVRDLQLKTVPSKSSECCVQ